MNTAGALVERALMRLDGARSGWALFAALLPLMLLLLAPTAWISNEENYFQLAYQRVAPDQFGEHHAVFDHSRARIVAETLLGGAVKWLGYEPAHVVLRIVLAFFYAGSLAIFFSSVGIGALGALVVVAGFCVMGEQLMGGEWLFRGVEAKTFAYSSMFVAIGFALRRRWLIAVAMAAAATYLHFLVGGFWTLMLLCMQLRQQRNLKRVLLSAALFGLLIAPLMVVVVPHDVVSLLTTTPSQGPSADFIYSELRGAEHVAPFSTRWAFWTWVPGIVVTCSLLGVLLGLQRRTLLPEIGLVSMWGLCYLLAALVLAFFDRHDNYLGKFYLFRPSSLILFLALTAIVLAVTRQCADNARWALALVATAFVSVFAWNTLTVHIDLVRRTPGVAYERALIDAIETHSAPDDIVLIEPFNEMSADYVRLHRVIPRPTLVSWKFAPTNPSDLLRWYDLIRRRERLFVRGCAAPMQPAVKLLVVFHREIAPRLRDCGEVVWEHPDALLMRLRDVASNGSR